MLTYFEQHPQRVPQWNRVRRGGGRTAPQVVVHTFEAPAGRSWQDGARYLAIRDSFGSYHWLSDALGGAGHLAPWSSETFHSTPNNNWSVGISMMAQAAAWHTLTPTQRRNLVNGAALGAHRFSRWCVANGLGAIPARRITRAQAMSRVAGFISHGEMDPGRRTDPGAGFPWDQFFAEFRRLESGATPATPTPPTPERTWLEMVSEADLRRVVTEVVKPIRDAQAGADGIENTSRMANRRLMTALPIIERTRSAQVGAEGIANSSLMANRRLIEALPLIRQTRNLVGKIAEREGVTAAEIEQIVADSAIDPADLVAELLDGLLEPLTDALVESVGDRDAEEIAKAVLAHTAAALTRKD